MTKSKSEPKPKENTKPKSKNIVICMDGTGNEIEENISNVLKIYRAAQKDDSQYVFYTQGVGTLLEAKPWSKLSRWFRDQVLGGAFGFGLEQRVQAAYAYIVEHFRPGDQLFIFGFSRGAYSARVLAGMLHAIGVLRPHQKNLIGAAYMAYMAEPRLHRPMPRPEKPDDDAQKAAVLDEEAMQEIIDGDEKKDRRAQSVRRITQSHDSPITFLGLFDTVSSVFAPTYFSKTWKPFSRSAHPHTYFNPSVKTVYHALAIDERRYMFTVDRWPSGQFFRPSTYSTTIDDQTAVERWFAGYHSDVGGGHERAKSGLSQFPLIWMLDAAEAEGFKTRSNTRKYVTGVKPYTEATKHVYPPADVNAPVHPSLNTHTGRGLFFWFTEFLIYPPNKTRPEQFQEKGWIWPRGKKLRKFLEDDVADESLCQRTRVTSLNYSPGNLPSRACPPNPDA